MDWARVNLCQNGNLQIKLKDFVAKTAVLDVKEKGVTKAFVHWARLKSQKQKKVFKYMSDLSGIDPSLHTKEARRLVNDDIICDNGNNELEN